MTKSHASTPALTTIQGMTSIRLMSTGRITSLIFIFTVFLRQSRAHSLHRRVALPSTPPPPQHHGRARRTPSALSRVRPQFDGVVQPSSATARERHQGVHAVAVVMATTLSVANNDLRQALGCRVLLESPPISCSV